MSFRPSLQGSFKYVFSAILLGAVALTGIRLSQPVLPGATAKDRIKAERVVPLAGGATEEKQLAPAGTFIAGNGVIEPRDRESKVASVVGGRIAEYLVKEGDVVEKGAALARLDNEVETAALEAAEGDVLAARAEVTRTFRNLRKEDVDAIVADTEATRQRAEISKNSLVRVEELGKSGAATADELDRARRQAHALKTSASRTRESLPRLPGATRQKQRSNA
jgi:multidrug efflux pump subunit AcrA (membrane-fusion protein)